jgi:hypothetical protein
MEKKLVLLIEIVLYAGIAIVGYILEERNPNNHFSGLMYGFAGAGFFLSIRSAIKKNKDADK